MTSPDDQTPGLPPLDPSETKSPRSAASRRTRSLLIGGVTAALLVAAWGGATMYAAGQAQQIGNDAAKTLDTTLRANHFGRVKQHIFTRGLTESTDDLYLVLGEPTDGGTDTTDAYVLHLRNHIQNGPLPGLQQVGQAVVDTEIIWDPKTQALLDKAFAGKKPTIHTLVGLSGTTTTTVQVPAGTYTADGSTATWGALAGQFSVSDAGRGVNGTLSWPGDSVGSPEGTVTAKGLQYSVQQRPYLKHLSQGTSSMTLNSVQFPGKLGHLNGLKLMTTTAPSGANLNSRSDLTVAALNVMDQTYSRSQLSLSASGLNSAALEGINEVMKRPEYQNAFKSEDPETLDASLKKLVQDIKPALRKLLAGNPRLAVNEVSVQTPQGPLKLSLGAQVVNGGSIPLDALLNEDTLNDPESDPAVLGLLSNIKLTADITGSQKAIASLLDESGDDTAAGIAQSIDPMVQEGMITRKGDQLSTHLEFGKEGASINGKPVPLQ